MIKILVYISLSLLYGCSEKPKETTMKYPIQKHGAVGIILEKAGIPIVGEEFPIPQEVVILENEIQNSPEMQDRYVSLIEGAFRRIASALYKDIEASREDLISKFNQMLDNAALELSNRFPHIQNEIVKAVVAYKKKAFENAQKGILFVAMDAIPEVKALYSKARELGIAGDIERAWLKFGNSLVVELKNFLKPCLQRLNKVYDEEIDKISSQFVREYPQLSDKVAAAAVAMKQQFRIQVDRL
jgi:hypothetical protein